MQFSNMSKMNVLDWIAAVLVIIGGLNWGLVGLFDFDVIATIFGAMSIVSRIIYVVVGVGALYMIATVSKCSKGSSTVVQ